METETATQKTIQGFKFEIGKKYTLFAIGDMLAMTSKSEIEVKELDPQGNPIFVHRGKRKKYILKTVTRSCQSAPLKPYEGAIFEGWDQPITCDTDKREGIMRGNACYNFMGKPEVIREWIESKQLNAHFKRTSVLAFEDPQDHDGVVVFAHEYNGGHAVIDRTLNK